MRRIRSTGFAAALQMLGAALLIGLAGCVGEPDPSRPAPGESASQVPDEARVEAAIASIDAFRSMQAATISPDQPVDGETFAQVCKPVGGRLKALADSTGWVLRQAATRFRNPANAATPAEAERIARFEADPTLLDVWEEVPEGRLYARRIVVEGSCLVCHGPRDERPGFVTERYPQDRAHSFQAGDLRGVYTVLVTADS